MSLPKILSLAGLSAVLTVFAIPTEASAQPQFLQRPANPQRTPQVPAAVPEPSAWALMFLGLAATGGAVRYSRRRTKDASPDVQAHTQA
jgi:hypothetical protein